ncbi:hypothetical protein [Pontibacter mangrovi]|uniref:Uncharacterized protein n=1 Tax=Pontibacter mangrovi TaxID=2589816 RepID=A0A501W0H6_9BACT|nr:hypothetical protein [Pontibacter mangrovi]TPE42115.1 hypothetical protein FJM65_18695 [Pontibacter mangrovi]
MEALFQTREFIKRGEKPDLTPYFIILLLCGLILQQLWPEDWYALILMLPAAALSIFQRYYLDSGKQKRYGSLGRFLNLEKEGIRARGKLYSFGEIEGLVVNVKDYDGMKKVSTYAVSEERGVDNFIAFTYQNETYKFSFYLKSAEHQKQLRAVLDALVVSGISMETYFKNKRSTIF